MNPDSDSIDAVFTDLGEAILQPPTWVVENLIPTGITFVVAPPKSYKSTFLMGVACSVAGIKNEVLPDWLQIVPEHGRVVGLSAEASAGELRYMIEKGFGVKVPDDRSILIADDPWQFRLDDPGATRRLLGWLEVLQPKLFFLDPLVDFHSCDEKEAGEMNRLLRPIQQWAKKNDCAFVVVHHSRKIGSGDEERNTRSDDMRGSSALHGLADATLAITSRQRGSIFIDATIKRGEKWEKSVKLGAWGEKASEQIDATALQIFEMLATGQSQAAIASELKTSKTRVSEAVAALKRLGAVTATGSPTENGSELARAAVRKFVPNSP